MAGDRLLRILARLEAGAGSSPRPTRLCEVCAEVMCMTGAGIMLMSGEVRRGSVCSSNHLSARIEDLQYTLGDGPCIDAYERDRPVVEPDLAGNGVSRWPAFTPLAVEAGARAAFGFPSGSAPSASAPSTSAVTASGPSATTSTPTPWWWPA